MNEYPVAVLAQNHAWDKLDPLVELQNDILQNITISSENDGYQTVQSKNHKKNKFNNHNHDSDFRCNTCFMSYPLKGTLDHIQHVYHRKYAYFLDGKWQNIKCCICGTSDLKELVIYETENGNGGLICQKHISGQRVRLGIIKETRYSLGLKFLNQLRDYFEAHFISAAQKRLNAVIKEINLIKHRDVCTRFQFYNEISRVVGLDLYLEIPHLSEVSELVWESFNECHFYVRADLPEFGDLKNSGNRTPFHIGDVVYAKKPDSTRDIWPAYITEVEEDIIRIHNSDGEWVEQTVGYTVKLKFFIWCERIPQNSTDINWILADVQTTRIIKSLTDIGKNKQILEMLLGQTKVFQDLYSTGENLVYYSSRLNHSQKRIVAHALHGKNAVTLVQGPPGTGKTTVIVELVRQFLPTYGKSSSDKILVCAQTNAAVDNVCAGLLKMEVAGILRIVPAAREDDYSPEHAIGSVCLHNLVNPLLSESTLNVLRVLKSGTKADKEALIKKEIKSALTEKSKISSAFIKGSKILCTTAIGSKSPIIVKSIVNIPVVIMDEATQCNVPTSLVPFSMPGLKKIVIVGDDKQLSGFSEIPYLEKSLFVRLQETKMVAPLMLDTQYRMHPDISAFPRNKFYNGELLDGIGAKHRTLDIPGLPKPLTFITYGHKYQESIILQPSPVTGIVAPSYRNRSEAKIVVETIKKLVSKDQFTQDRVAIITPYAPQRDLLALLIMKDKVLNPLGLKIKEEGMNTGNDENNLESVSLQRKSSTGKPPTVMTVNGISISSVDAYQGREQDVVIFSCVRSNKAGRIGFLSDARRLNVALTRARCGLIMVGNRFCLRSGDPLWEDLMTHFDNNGAIITDVNRYLGLDRRGRKIAPRDGGNGFTYASNDIIGDAGETVESGAEEDGEDGYFVELSDDEGASQSNRGSRIVNHVADGIAEMQLMVRDI